MDLAVGLLDRDLDGDLAVGGPEDDPEIVGELQAVGREIEVVADDVEVGHLGALARLATAFGLRLHGGILDGLRGLVRVLTLPDGPVAVLVSAIAILRCW